MSPVKALVFKLAGIVAISNVLGVVAGEVFSTPWPTKVAIGAVYTITLIFVVLVLRDTIKEVEHGESEAKAFLGTGEGTSIERGDT